MSFDILFFTHLLNGLIMMFFPIGIAIYLTRKFKQGWRLFWIGGFTFIASQVFHIPFNNWFFSLGIIPRGSSTGMMVIPALALGLSAGLFEEIARYIVYRWWAKDARSWSKGLLLGIGHGGMEAILLGLLVLVNFLYLAAYRGQDLTRLFPPDQLALAQQQISAYWAIPWYGTLLGAVERIFAVTIQISLSILVLQAFTRRNIIWLVFAILWHTIVDASAVYVLPVWGAHIAEGIVAILAVLSLGIIFILRQPEAPEPPQEELPPLKPASIVPIEVDDTPESLQNSRFNE
ncbi:MAG: YhfC family glutamic-type intramembrane protease [Omnitrophica WOR_2 bacterium]